MGRTSGERELGEATGVVFADTDAAGIVGGIARGAGGMELPFCAYVGLGADEVRPSDKKGVTLVGPEGRLCGISNFPFGCS